MASSLGATSSNSEEQIRLLQVRLLQAQAEAAAATQKAAEQAVANFSVDSQHEQTPENVEKLKALLARARAACVCAAGLREQVSAAELAYYNPKNSCLPQSGEGQSLKNKQVIQLNLDQEPGDLSETLGYYPE